MRFRLFSTMAAVVGLLALSGVSPALAAPDMILINGKVITVDSKESVAEAVAIEKNKITAVGRTADIKKMADNGTKVVDLDGRTVVPGLIDSHIHAIRGALTFGRELRWTEEETLKSALNKIAEATKTTPKGEWITVVGGWHMSQFPENRLPAPEELTRIAPDHPVYVQHLYSEAILNKAGLAKLDLKEDKQIPPKGKLERDKDGNPTGNITGNVPTFARLYGKLPQPTLEDRKNGTKAFFRELNRLGMTGIVDAAGGGMFDKHYEAVESVWKDGDLSLRVRFRRMPQPPHRGKELSIIKTFTDEAQEGDEWYKFNGVGEVVIWGMHDGDRVGRKFTPKDESKAALKEALLWIADKGWPMEIHASSDSSARQILDIIEEVDKQKDISNMRWVVAHIDDAKPDTLKRIASLGMGWSVQDRLYYSGDEVIHRIGEANARKAPPLKTGVELGIKMGAGTDAHRVSPYSPMTSLQWILDGESVAGTKLRGDSEIPRRIDALKMYTIFNAWFSFEEDIRGSIEPGKLADLAVLSHDFMTAPVEQISDIVSLLTIVDGKVVYADGPYKAMEKDM